MSKCLARFLIALYNRDEKEITTIYAATAEDVDIAVKAARTAFKKWRDVGGTDRGDLMLKLSKLVEEHSHTLATIDTWDNGKPLSDAMGDIAEVAQVFKYYGGYADKLHGSVCLFLWFSLKNG